MRSQFETELDHLRARVEELERDLARARAGAPQGLAQIIAEVRDPICQFDRQRRYVWVNDAYERFAGIPRFELLGKTPVEAAVPAPLANVWMETVTLVVESGEEVRCTSELATDSAQGFFESRFSAHRTESGEIDHVTVITHEVTKQKRAERDLEMARDQLHAILDSISESFLALDREWRFIYVNKQVLALTGRTREALIGHSIWDVFPILRDSRIRTEFEKVMRDREPAHFEADLDQAGRWFGVHAYPSNEGITAYVIEITDWKRSDNALREAHETLSALVHASPLPIISFKPDGNLTVWNEAAERTFGWTADEVLGKPLPFIPAEKMEEHRALRARDLSGLGFTGIELERRRKDGSLIDIRVSTAPIRLANGEVGSIVSVCEDITERKRIERALRESGQRLRDREEMFRLATESAGVGIWTYDVVTDRLKMSALAAKLVGLEEHEIEMGVRDFLELVCEVDRQRVKHHIRETLEFGIEYLDEYRVHSQDETRWVAARGLATTDAAGNRIRFSGVISDTTDRKRTEQELGRHAQELARSNADLQQFAFVTSHDLQEPLRTITAYAQLLSRHSQSVLDKDGLEYLTFIVDGATRMQQLINDLLAFSRILHDHERAPGEVEMEAVFAWVVMNLNKAIKESGAEITHDALPAISANQQEMVQLMQNLLSNAIKYRGPEPPAIHVDSEEFEDEVRISVRDNGIGIDSAYHDQIFGVFKRLHGKDVPGTGIGLALCKRIVEKHGGRIWVESTAGAGSTFRFTLPR